MAKSANKMVKDFGLTSISSAILALVSLIYAYILYKSGDHNAMIFFTVTYVMSSMSLFCGGVLLGIETGRRSDK